ncbi:RAMP superfamily CRISPR-associated protein [Streptomyces sp. NPDC005393]|uniref:RAMP superfamily CRISPR-associated protein n=1 Tax=Streptomyces sp. NPDC005393 TaxID=3157041 RepID=UPI0033B273BC
MSVVHILRAELELATAGAVTAPESLTIGSVLRPDLPVARDAWDRPYLPGTSPAGSLRQQAHRTGREEALFGNVRPGNGTDAPPSETVAIASPIRLLGTRLDLPQPLEPAQQLEIRRRTAIDRHRAAAQPKTLHSRELLPPETKILLWLRLDTPSLESPLLDELVDLLATWRPVVGRGRTTGHGQALLTRVLKRSIDLDTADGMRHWLMTGGPALVDDHATVVYDHEKDAVPSLLPELFGQPLQFRITDALHIGSGNVLDRPGHRTGVSAILRDHDNLPIVPGSTWKGVLRARCEFILRSVGLNACSSVGENAGPCGDCVLCEAFGWTERTGAHKQAPPDAEPPPSVGARGRLVFADTVVRESTVRIRNHVALDRVFGGARDAALYTEETIENGTVTVSIRHDRDIPELARAALLLALDDLAAGRFGIGAGTTRGQGTLTALSATGHLLGRERTRAVETLRLHHAALTEEAPA